MKYREIKRESQTQKNEGSCAKKRRGGVGEELLF